MSNIQATSSFSFHDNNIRVQGTPDEPLFCLADVCKTLDLTSPNKVVAQIKEEFNIRGELNSGLIKDANNHTQTATFITEPQLYFVMMRSRVKVAKEFRQWVVNEVLPSIRKTGAYIQSSKTEHQSYLKIFKDFCLQHNYSSEELKMFDYLREQALKQGYAIACSQLKERVKQEHENVRQLKDDEVAVKKDTIKKIYLYFNWHSIHKKDMKRAAEMMREQASVLYMAADGYALYKDIIKQDLFDKL